MTSLEIALGPRLSELANVMLLLEHYLQLMPACASLSLVRQPLWDRWSTVLLGTVDDTPLSSLSVPVLLSRTERHSQQHQLELCSQALI